MSAEGVTIGLLGSFELRVDGALVELPQQQARIVLASLALEVGHPVPVDSLAERLWGDSAPASHRTGVHNTVRRLRGLLGHGAIRTSPGGYVLAVGEESVDVARFRRVCQQAASMPPRQAHATLSEAQELWRGQPLSGVDSGSLVRDYRPELTETHLGCVELWADSMLAVGRASEALPQLRRLTAAFPRRESLWLRLLSCLDGAGQQAEALTAYERMRRTLADRLGVDPSADLQALHQRLLSGESAVVGTPSRRKGPGDSGTEAAAPDPVGVPRQLPVAQPLFVGRSRELAELAAVDEPGRIAGSPALTVLHGAGGVGKTALALAWAHGRAANFPDGQLYVNLHGFGPGEAVDPVAALGEMLRALGVDRGQLPPGLAERAALLRSTVSGRRILLLLDNARDEAQVRPLLPGSGGVVVVTSRNQLRGLAVGEGARRVAVNELPAAEAVELLAELLGADRVRAERAALAELVELCGRLPLALRIAGELGAMFPDEKLVDLVDTLKDPRHRLSRLDTGDQVTDPRTVFSWSYASLDAATARTFRLLGLHPGGEISVPGAAALTDLAPGTARSRLDRLSGIHLVEEPQPGRYQLHDLLRDYAGERSAAEDDVEDQVSAIRRLVSWQVHAADVAARALDYTVPVELDTQRIPPPSTPLPDLADHDAALRWFETEREALIAGVQLAAVHGFDDHGYALAQRLRDVLDRRRYLEDLVDVCATAVSCAERIGAIGSLCTATRNLGYALNEVHDTDAAGIALRRALGYADMLDDPDQLAPTLYVFGIHQLDADDAGAIESFERSVAAARQGREPRLLGHALLNLSFAHLERFTPDSGRAAADAAEEALRVYRETGTELHQALATSNLASAYQRLGRSDAALHLAHEAELIFRRTRDVDAMMDLLLTVGRIHRDLGHLREARRAWKEILSTERSTRDRRVEASHLLATGERVS